MDIFRHGENLNCTSLKMASRVAKTCGKNTAFMIQDTFIYLCAFVGFVAMSNCSMQGYGLFKIKNYFEKSSRTYPRVQCDAQYYLCIFDACVNVHR